MSIFIALVLGIVQGLTEFLPVSSSGHLILLQHVFELPSDMLLFNIVLHIATLCAVLIMFRKKIWQLVRHPWNKTNLCLVISTAITCTLVVLFKDLIDRTFHISVLPFAFMATAIILFMTSFVGGQSSKPKLLGTPNHVTYQSAIFVGIAQAIAVVPGLSRSGTTISTLLFTGTKREQAAEFSFLMSIPIIIASFAYELMDVGSNIAIDIVPTAVAFVAALLSGIIAIKFMLAIIRRVKFHWFSYYLVILAMICLFL